MMPERKPSIAVISPFLDKQHGTERCIVEQLDALAGEFEFHIYSSRVRDLDLTKVTWHHVPDIPGPLLLKYVWFFCANHLFRALDKHFRKLAIDMTYSPGINSANADLIAVHIVFAEFQRRVQEDLRFSRNPWTFWPTLLHRRIFYNLIIFLERRIYSENGPPLIAVSGKVRDDVRRFYAKGQNVFTVYNGIDAHKFDPAIRQTLRDEARAAVGYLPTDTVLLLIGNDWKKKGLACLLEAVEIAGNPRLKIAVVGEDDPSPFRSQLERPSLASAVRFLGPRPDVEFFYALADFYTGPSLEDAFGIPPLEAMACGLPVVVSRQSGVSELITHGEDGFILEDPRRAKDLAAVIRTLCGNAELAKRIGQRAAATAIRYTWDRNVSELRSIFHQTLAKKNLLATSSLRHGT